MEYLGYIVALVIGIYIGFKANDIIMRATFESMIREAGLDHKDLTKLVDHFREEMIDEDDLDQVSIKIERHNDTLYAFRKDNDEFLGQGATKEDLIVRLGEKLRNVKLVITPEDGADFIGGSFNFDVTTKEIKQNG